MCGIAGAIWNQPSAALDSAALGRMCDLLRHRGPDGEGTFREEYRLRPPYDPQPGVALGHRRLAIIDLATGQQPMAGESGEVRIVFNGEIYNFRDLRRRLQGAGHVFRTQSDTEAIVHLFEDEKLECFSRLAGMFALAIYDARERRLVLARDRLGKKPLYYWHTSERLVFASELKALASLRDFPRELDAGAIDEYLTYQYVPHPNTIYRAARQLPPGHFAVWQDGKLDVRPYWRPDFNLEQNRPGAEWVDELRELFRSAVQMRLESDVPLGVFLSGGIDSSLTAAMMAKLVGPGERIKTFTIGFAEAAYDESAAARRVAEHLGSEHHQLIVRPQASEVLPRLVEHFDEPFADSSAIPTFSLAELAREQVKVSLAGDGGDELFAGYSRYKAAALAATIDRVPLVRHFLAARLWQKLPHSHSQRSLVRRFQRFASGLNLPPARRYLDWVAIFGEQRRAALYTDDFLARLPDSDPAGFVTLAWERAAKRDAVTAASMTDLVTYLPGDLLVKVDRATMACGLECREPWLDHRLVELAAAMPARWKYHSGRGKRIVQTALGELLPSDVWNRRKQGFGAPLAEWFRGPWADVLKQSLLDSAALTRTYFRPEAVTSLVDEHQSGRFDHAARLWALVVLEHWLRRWTQ